MSASKRILKIVRNVVTTGVVLLILIVGAGAGYTWYMGQQTPDQSAAAPVPESQKLKAPTLKPPVVSDDAKVGASVQSLTSPISPGDDASITVKTNPDSECSIEVVYDKTPSKDQGLVKKTADEFGMVSWDWIVELSAPLGKWPVKVTCVHGEQSGFVQGDLKVEKLLQ